MSRGPTTFRQRDAAALIKAALAAGLNVERVEVGRDGKIVLVTKQQGGDYEMIEEGSNEWDEIIK